MLLLFWVILTQKQHTVTLVISMRVPSAPLVRGSNVRKDDDNVDFAPFLVGLFVFTPIPPPCPINRTVLEHANRGT